MLIIILAGVIAGCTASAIGVSGWVWRARLKAEEDRRAMFELIEMVEDDLKQRALDLEAFHHDEAHLITLMLDDVLAATRLSTGNWQLQFLNGDRMTGQLPELLARYHAMTKETELRIPQLTTTMVDLKGLKHRVIDILDNPPKLTKRLAG